MFGSPTVAVIDGTTKYLTNLTASHEYDLCFDIADDPFETENIADRKRDECRRLRGFLEDFIASARNSHGGADYQENWDPITDFQEPSDW